MLDLDGKTILVSLRKINDEGQQSFDTFFGKVLCFNDNTVLVSRPCGAEQSLPYDEDFYEEAEPGLYELDDGTTYEDPDFIAQWTVFQSEKARVQYHHLNDSE
ncbi:hypothetical protein [Syntrophotalea carbinolica]|uniref:hypothetical protein n=1 Tax=Syntrophotalea carbinolica TaxID=19 RepID=UPI0005A1767F|nr:hypothetical protein [Syntrophotalea carbinolica]